MDKILEVIGTIEDRMIDWQGNHGFETVFDFIGEDLEDIRKEVKNNSSISNVSVSLFDEALRVLRDLAEHQNGAPLIRHEEDYNKTMTEVWDFLEANETE